MAKLRYNWNGVASGDIISFSYNKKRRTVIDISTRYRITKVDKSRVELMSGLQLEVQERAATNNLFGILKQLGKIVLVNEKLEIYKIRFDGRKLDAEKRKLSSNVKELVIETNDLYRTYDYKKMRKESPIIMLDDLRSLPRSVLKEAVR